MFYSCQIGQNYTFLHIYTPSKFNVLRFIHSGGSSKNPLVWQHASLLSAESAETQQLKRTKLIFLNILVDAVLILIQKIVLLIELLLHDKEYECSIC